MISLITTSASAGTKANISNNTIKERMRGTFIEWHSQIERQALTEPTEAMFRCRLVSRRRLQEADDIRKVCFAKASFKTFGHEREIGAVQRGDVGTQQGSRFSIGQF